MGDLPVRKISVGPGGGREWEGGGCRAQEGEEDERVGVGVGERWGGEMAGWGWELGEPPAAYSGLEEQDYHIIEMEDVSVHYRAASHFERPTPPFPPPRSCRHPCRQHWRVLSPELSAPAVRRRLSPRLAYHNQCQRPLTPAAVVLARRSTGAQSTTSAHVQHGPLLQRPPHSPRRRGMSWDPL